MNKPQKEKIQSKKETYKSIAPFLNLGLQMALTILIFVLIGYKLDENYNKSPIFILIFSFLGIFASFYNFFKQISKIK